MGYKTVDSLARAEIRKKIEEAELHLKDTINSRILPLLSELPGLFEETKKYYKQEREKIYHRCPHLRPEKQY